jgi:cell wall-associated NlpC family hydrolase
MNGIKAGYIDIGIGYDTRQVDRMLKDLQRQIAGTPLAPFADLNNMHEFNRVMDSKKADWRDLNREIKNNPLKPQYDGSQLKELSRQVSTLRADLQKEIRGAVAIQTQQVDTAIAKVKALNAEISSVRQNAAINANIATSVRHTIDGSKAAESITKAFDSGAGVIEKAISKSFKSARGSGIGGLLTAPFRLPMRVAQDVFTGAGYELGRRAASGISAPLDKGLSQIGSNIEQYAAKKANEYAIQISKLLGFKNTRESRAAIEELGKALDVLYSPRKQVQLVRTAEKRVSNAAQDAATKKERFFNALTREYQVEIDRITDTFWATLGRATQPGRRVASIGLRINKDVQIARQAQRIDEFAGRVNVDPSILRKANQTGNLTIIAPGLHGMNGQGGTVIQPMLRQFTPNAATVVSPNYDMDSDNPRFRRLQKLYDRSIGRIIPRDIESPLQYIAKETDRFGRGAIKSFENQILGSNDALRHAATARAYQKAGFKGNVNFFGYSAGVADAQEATRISQKAGIDARGAGVGGIVTGMGLRPTSSFTQYQGGRDWTSLSTRGDFDVLFKNLDKADDLGKALNAVLGGIPTPFLANAAPRPQPGTIFSPTAGAGHGLQAYLADPSIQSTLDRNRGYAHNYSFQGMRGAAALQAEKDLRSGFTNDLFPDVPASSYKAVFQGTGAYDELIKSAGRNKRFSTGRSLQEYEIVLEQLQTVQDALIRGNTKEIEEAVAKARSLGDDRNRLYSQQPIVTPAYSVIKNSERAPEYNFQPKNYQVVQDPPNIPQYIPPLTAIEKFQGQALELKERVFDPVMAIGTEAVDGAKKLSELAVQAGKAARQLEEFATGGWAEAIRQRFVNNWGTELTPYRPVGAGGGGTLNTVGNVARGVYGGMQRGEQMAFDAAGLVLPGWVLPTTKKALQYGGTFAAANALLPGVGGAILHGGGAIGGAAGAGLGGALTSWIGGALPTALTGGLSSLAGAGIPLLSPAIASITAGAAGTLPALLGGAGTVFGAGTAGLLAARGATNLAGSTLNAILPGDSANNAAQQLTGKAFNLLGAGINKAAKEFSPAQSATAQIEGAAAQLGLPSAGELEKQNKELEEIRQTITNIQNAAKGLKEDFGLSISNVASGQFSYFDAANAGKAILGSETELAKTRYVEGFLRDKGLDQEFSQINTSQTEIGRFKSRAYESLISQLPQIQAAAKAGDDTAEGFLNALIRAIPEIEKIANTQGQKYIASLKEALGVRSPSWITALIAEDTIQGFLNQGESGISDLEKLAKKMGLSFTEEMKAAMLADIPEYKKVIDQIQEQLNKGDLFSASKLAMQLPDELRRSLSPASQSNSTYQVLSDVRGQARSNASDQLKALGIDLNLDEVRRSGKKVGEAFVDSTATVIKRGKKEIENAVKTVVDTQGSTTIVAGVGGFFDGIKQGIDDLQQRFPILQQFKGQLIELGFAIGGLIGVYSLGDFFIQFGRDSLAAANSVDVLEDRLQSFGTGQDYKGFERLSSIANQLGFDYRALEQDYLRMSSVLSKTDFASEAEPVFGSLSRIVQGLSAAEVSRFFTAVTQVVSKRKLVREEFTTQFGDLPGVNQTIVQAVSGGDDAEFQRRLTAGDISSDEFIRSLTEYSKFLPTLDNATTKTNTFRNALTALQVQTGESIQPAFFAAMEAATSLMTLLVKNSGYVTAGMVGLGVAGIKPLAELLGSLLIPRIKELLLHNGILITQNGVTALSWKGVSTAMVGAGKAAGVLLLSLGKIALIGASISFLGDAYKSLAKDSESFAEAIARSDQALAELGQRAKETESNLQFQIENGFLSENHWTRLSDQVFSFFNKLNAETNKFLGISEDFGRFTTFGDLEVEKQARQLATLEQRTIDAVALVSGGGGDAAVKNAKEQIEALRSVISNLEQGNNGDFTRAQVLEIENAKTLLGSMEASMAKMAGSSGETVNRFKDLQTVLGEITDEFERQSVLIREQASSGRVGVNEQVLSGNLTPLQAERLRDQINIQEQIAQRNALQARLSGARSNLAISASRGFGAALRGNQNNDEEVRRQQEEAQKEIDATQAAIIQANEAISDGQLQIQQKLEQQQVSVIESTRQLTDAIENYYRNLAQQQRDLTRQIEDFVVSTQDQFAEIQREIKQTKTDTVLAAKVAHLRGALLKTSSDLVSGIIEQVVGIIEKIHERTRQQLQFAAQRQQIEQSIRAIAQGASGITDNVENAVFANQQERGQITDQYIQTKAKELGLSPLQIQRSLAGRDGGPIANKIVEVALSREGEEFRKGVAEQCANWVRSVLEQAGVKLGVTRNALDGLSTGPQLASSFFGADIGQIIKDKSELKPGDIVAFSGTYGGYGKDTITHVGIYAGNQEIVDRSTSSAPVRRRSIDTFDGPNSGFYAGVRPYAYGASAPAVDRSSQNLQRYLARIAAGESSGGTNIGPNPSTGAYGRYQFTPSTRNLLLNQKPGADPWSPDQAIAGKAALNWIELYGREKGVDILGLIKNGNFAKADELLGRAQFTSLPGGAEESAIWRDRSNLSKYGPYAGGGTGTSAGGTINLANSPINNLATLQAPSTQPVNATAQQAIAGYQRLLTEQEKLENRQAALADLQIRLDQGDLRRQIDQAIQQNEEYANPQTFNSLLKDLYQGLPESLVPSRLRGAQDSGDLGQIKQITQDLADAQRDATGLIELAKVLQDIPEYKLGQVGITPELLSQLQQSQELRKTAVEKQLEELQNAQRLKDVYEQLNAETARANLDNAAIQDELSRQIDLQNLYIEALNREGKSWEANALSRKLAAQQIENLKDQELRRIDALRQQLTIGIDNGYTFDQLDLLQDYATKSASASSAAIQSQYQTIAGSILETSKSAVQSTISSFRQLVSESTSIGDFFENFFSRIIDTIGDALLSIVSQLATNGLFDQLGKIFNKAPGGGPSSSGGANILGSLFSIGTNLAGAFGGAPSGAFFNPGAGAVVPAGFGAFSTGTVLSGYGGGDRIPALLEGGEAVLRKEVVADLTPGLIDQWNSNAGVTRAMRGFTPSPQINRGYRPKASETEGRSTDLSQPLEVKTRMINSVEYMTKEDGIRLAQQAQAATLSKIRNSVGTRKGLGL